MLRYNLNYVASSGSDYHFENGEDIGKNAIQKAELSLLHDEDDFLPDHGLRGTNDLNFTAARVMEIWLKLHQSHLLQELFSTFKETNPIQDTVSLEMVMIDDTLEAAENGCGLVW